MIPANGFEARYNIKAPDGTAAYTESTPVVAWDDNGEPLVVSTSSGRLVHPGGLRFRGGVFAGIREMDCEQSGIGVIPGGGWMATTKWPDGTERTRPVVGFVVARDGYGQPLVDVHPEPDLSLVAPAGSDTTIWHPSTNIRIFEEGA